MLYGKEKIEEFIDKVLSTDEAFTIADGGSSPDWYIQTRVSKSKFVYETKSYNGEGDARIPGFSAEFVAMVTDGKVYISMPVLRRRPLRTRRKANRWWTSSTKL